MTKNHNNLRSISRIALCQVTSMTNTKMHIDSTVQGSDTTKADPHNAVGAGYSIYAFIAWKLILYHTAESSGLLAGSCYQQ